MREVPKYYAHEVPLDAFAVKDRVRGLLGSVMIFIKVSDDANPDLVTSVDKAWKLHFGCRNHSLVKLFGFILSSVCIMVAVGCFLSLCVSISVVVDFAFSLARCHYLSNGYLYFLSLGVITSVTADVEKLVVSLLPSALPPDQEHIKLVTASGALLKFYSNEITLLNKMNRAEKIH